MIEDNDNDNNDITNNKLLWLREKQRIDDWLAISYHISRKLYLFY